jgi:hypothetical protein
MAKARRSDTGQKTDACDINNNRPSVDICVVICQRSPHGNGADALDIQLERAIHTVGYGQPNGGQLLHVHGVLDVLDISVRREEKVDNWDLCNKRVWQTERTAILR